MRLTTVLAAALAAFLVSDMAAAQNLVANGDFHVGAASWTPGSMTLFEWNSADWQGDPTSGIGAPDERRRPARARPPSNAWSCRHRSRASYELGAAVYLEAPPQAASASVRVFAHEGAACQGAALGSFQGGIVNQQGTWVSLLNPAIQLPPTTQSVTILHGRDEAPLPASLHAAPAPRQRALRPRAVRADRNHARHDAVVRGRVASVRTRPLRRHGENRHTRRPPPGHADAILATGRPFGPTPTRRSHVL